MTHRDDGMANAGTSPVDRGLGMGAWGITPPGPPQCTFMAQRWRNVSAGSHNNISHAACRGRHKARWLRLSPVTVSPAALFARSLSPDRCPRTNHEHITSLYII